MYVIRMCTTYVHKCGYTDATTATMLTHLYYNCMAVCFMFSTGTVTNGNVRSPITVLKITWNSATQEMCSVLESRGLKINLCSCDFTGTHQWLTLAFISGALCPALRQILLHPVLRWLTVVSFHCLMLSDHGQKNCFHLLLLVNVLVPVESLR